MDAVQGYVTWLPALLQDKDTGAGLKTIVWNASGLTVKYQKAGGSVLTKTLISGDWVEGVDGSYNIRFSANELDTLGLFSYWVEHPDSTTYPGAITVVAAPSTDMASETTLLSVGGTVGEIKTAVDALPTDVASSQNITDLSDKIDAINIPTQAAPVGFSVNATQNKALWLPVQLNNRTTGEGATGITFDTVTVKYQKSGTEVITKVLTTDQWSEGVSGAYNLYFTADELDTLGTLRYWVEHPDTNTYTGVALVTEPGAGPGSVEKTIRVSVKGQPIENCEIWVSSDAAGRDKIAGPRYTNVLGVATFYLDPGDYWVHYRKAREVEYGRLQWKVTSDG